MWVYFHICRTRRGNVLAGRDRYHMCTSSPSLSLSSLSSLVGTRDHTSLSQDTVPSRRDADRSAWRRLNAREALESQAEANHGWRSRQTVPRATCGQVRGVLCSHAEGIEECFRRGYSRGPGTTWAGEEEEMHPPLIRGAGANSPTRPITCFPCSNWLKHTQL